MSIAESTITPVHAFADRAWDQFLELNPLWATMQGDERWDDRLDDPGPDGRVAMLALAEAWEAEMDGFAGLELSVEDLLPDLARRRPGQSSITTQRKEADEPEILSGVFEGETTGTPIAVVIRNTDQRSRETTGAVSRLFR